MNTHMNLTRSTRFACLAIPLFFLSVGASAQQPTPDRTLVVLRGDAGVKVQDGKYRFDVGEHGEIAEVAVNRAPRGFLGLRVQDLSPELRAHFGAAEESGVIISKIEPSGPADVAGLEVGDILTGVNGVALTSALDFYRLERSFQNLEVVGLSLIRDGKADQLSAVATVRERPEVDVRSLVRSYGNAGPHVYQIDEATLAEELRRVVERLDSAAWQDQVRELSQVRERLDKRLQSLDLEIHHLERKVGDQALQ